MEKEIKQFWQDIIYKNGKIDEKQVMKELADFYFVMQEVPKVYCAITGGSLSKINYPSEVILGQSKALNSFVLIKCANSPKTIIPLGDTFFIEIRSVSKNSNIIELKTRGMNKPVSYNSVTRPKFIKKTTTAPKKEVKKIEVTQQVDKKLAW